MKEKIQKLYIALDSSVFYIILFEATTKPLFYI